MTIDTPPAAPRKPTQRARLSLRVGKHSRISARVDVTSEGLLAIGGLVSSILLSTAVLVGVAVRGKNAKDGSPQRSVAPPTLPR